MSALYMIVGTLVALGVLVTFHEFGHFWVARRCGVKGLRFSVGFGTPLLRWHDRQGTEFVVAAIPLGGYVKMLDEREGEVPADQLDQSFNRKTVGQRIAIVAAGEDQLRHPAGAGKVTLDRQEWGHRRHRGNEIPLQVIDVPAGGIEPKG